MRISLIVACGEDRVIGRNGDMPWRLSRDLRRFKELTMGHPMLMGRNTFESIGRPLPGRTSIVLTRREEYRPSGVIVVSSVSAALKACRGADEALVIGGAEIYREFLPLAQRIYLTRVLATFPDGDTWFPAVDFTAWKLTESAEYPSDEKNDYATRFEVWESRA